MSQPQLTTEVTFVTPMLGFSETSFILAEHQAGPAWFVLTSSESGYPAFLLADAFAFFPDYDIAVPPTVCADLDLEDPADALVFVTVNTQSSAGMTVNLAAPIVVNVRNGRATQVVQDLPYPTAAPLEEGN